MSFVHSEGKGDFAQGFQKSYISTKAFDGEFQTYATSMNASFQTVGTLTAVAGANSTNCPANRVLHFTGRKLVPGQHPNVVKVLVAVYDPISFLNGFIDPSSSTFAKYDQNMPNSFNDGRNGNAVPPLGGQAGKLTVPDAGQQLELTLGNGVAVAAGNASVGQVVMITTACIVNTTAATASSKIFLTQSSSTPAALAVTAQSAGSFTITGGSGATVNWLVIN